MNMDHPFIVQLSSLLRLTAAMLVFLFSTCESMLGRE
jgi:hypothetical protein